MEAPLFRAGSSHEKELLNRLEPCEINHKNIKKNQIDEPVGYV